MSTRTPHRPAALIAAVFLSLSAPAIVTADDDPSTWRWRSPVGVWRVMVTFVACDTDAPLRDPFPALNTFYADGNISETGSGLGPAFRGVSHGRWVWSGRSRIAVRSEFQLFDSNFIYYADQVADRRFEMSADGQSLTGRATYVRYAPDGTVLFQGCALESGTRQPGPAVQH